MSFEATTLSSLYGFDGLRTLSASPNESRVLDMRAQPCVGFAVL